MIRIQKLVTKRHIKKQNYKLDVTLFLVFEQQNSIKFIQRKNYKNTSFIHTNFLQNYNWVFWKKHTMFGLMPIDMVAYHNIINPIFTTQQFITNRVVLMYNLFSLNFNQNIILINTGESEVSSVAAIFPALSFYEREVSELFGFFFSKKKDTRNLLLDYSNGSNPMRKDYSPYGKADLRYTKFLDSPKWVGTSLNSV